MKKLLAVFLSLLFLGSNVFAQIDIKKEDRVSNIKPGYCAWCSLEMLGRHHHIQPLIGLRDARTKDPDVWLPVNGQMVLFQKHGGTPTTVRMKLNELHVKHKMSNTGNFDREMLKYAMKNKLGCVVGMRAGGLGPEAHAIVLTHYDDKKVEFADCNRIEHIWEAPRSWFDSVWDGWIVVVEKQDEEATPPTPEKMEKLDK